MEVDIFLHNKSKAEVAAAVRAACSSDSGDNDLSKEIVDKIFTNHKSLSDVDDEETLEWCKWLVSGGANPEEFAKTVRLYDKATTCGLVWTENFVAYRCRTCGISPFISLCTDCFHKGNHEGHDFIVFRSETGGACDCGEINVIKESGCCVLHGPRGTAAMQRAQNGDNGQGQNNNIKENNDLPSSSLTASSEQTAPPELFSVANKVMPRLFHRLIAYLRAVEARKLAQQADRNKGKKKSRPKTSPAENVSPAATAAAMRANSGVNSPPKGQKFIKLLQGYSDMGVTMRQLMTRTLTNSPAYKNYCGVVSTSYEQLGLTIPDYTQTFLDELVYWTVKREFPEDLVCLLLSLRSDYSYNECLARAFITHYELISQSILKSSDPERLCKHIAAVSVQLFSKEKLAIAMVEQMQLLHLLLRSLHEMIRTTAIPISSLPAISSSSTPTTTTTASSLSEEVKSENKEKVMDDDSQYSGGEISMNSAAIAAVVENVDNIASILKVIDCDNDIIKNNYYWLIKSDLKALLSHGPVATKFFNDPQLLSTWFEFLTLLQGMNVNKFVRKGEPHVEHEPDSYVGAFMAELVISAMLMWTLVSHLKDNSTSSVTLNFITLCRQQLRQWHQYVQYPKGTISFHLPLHRYFSTFLRQGLQFQGMQVGELLPPEEEFNTLVQQILRLQVAYYEISSRLWARNGPSLVNQAEYYVSSLCCNSMVDADLFLLQVAAVRSPGVSEENILRMIMKEFGMNEVLSIRKCFGLEKNDEEMSITLRSTEEQMTMLENFMLFLTIIATVRTNLGIADKDLMALEMSVLLCKSDRLHSELMEMLPERCGSDTQIKNFESVLERIADFQAPRNMQQGMFAPKGCVWEEIYDPVYTLLRSSSRAEYQSSRDRFQDYVKRSRKEINPNNVWPPFRLPAMSPSFMQDPGKILLSKTFMEIAFVILYHKLNTGIVSELTTSLCVYLLEVAVCMAKDEEELSGFLTEVRMPQKLEERAGEEKTGCIVSQLLELYSKLSDSRNHFLLKPENCEEELPYSLEENRIGDGPFFIAKVLEKYAEKSVEGKHYILRAMQAHQLDSSPSSLHELSREEREREEKRKKAKERKLLLMNEYAMKRQQFMDKSNDSFGEESNTTSSSLGSTSYKSSSFDLYKEYQDQKCVICMEELEKKPNNPYGLMTHLSPCHALGYQRLQTPDGDGPFLKAIHKETLVEYLKFYDDSNIIQHIPLDPGYGVQVQSCGHLMHQDCFTSFMNYVKKAPPPPPSSSANTNKTVHSITYKEYTCPLCRTVGNSFLPVMFTKTPMKAMEKVSGNREEITKLIKKRSKSALSNAEKIAVDRFIKDINGCGVGGSDSDLVKILEEFDTASPLISAFWLTSHLRVAVERQLKLNENSTSTAPSSSSSASTSSNKKISSLLPLLSVMKHQYKSLPIGYARKLAQNWGMICGKRNSKGNREVPTLLRDVEMEMYHLILELPILEDLNKGLILFRGVVQALYNLRVVQLLASICTQFNEAERPEIAQVYGESQSKAEWVMHLIFKNLGEVKAEITIPEVSSDIMKADENGNHKNVEIPDASYIEDLVQSLLTPFLKTAAHLQSELFGEQSTSSNSFLGLVEFLKLGQLSPSSMESNTTVSIEMENNESKSFWDFVLWTKCDDDVYIDTEVAIENWCSELIQSLHDLGKSSSIKVVSKNQVAGDLLKSHLYMYDAPTFIKLPKDYDTIFENYRKIKCLKCEQVPSTPALCLICGEILCLDELCCFDMQLQVSEVVSHCQKKCGRGTGIFLSVMTSEIWIVRETEACIWGSIFLDSFCEEDLELKRGKPLFLCQERLDILQRNWIAQSFYKAELKWFPHQNLL